MSVDLKTLTPDTTLPQDGVLFGADSQAAASPSVYPVSNVKTAMNSGIATLAGGNSIFWDMGANPVATVTLTDNATLYVSNYNAGGTYKLIVFQNITGNWTLSYDPNIKWPNNTAPTVSTAANAMTVLEFVSDGTFIYGTVSQAYDGWAPTVSSLFARPAGDYSTLPSTSTMPTGGSISRAGNAMLYDSTGQLAYAPNNLFAPSAADTNFIAAGTTPPTIASSQTILGQSSTAITFTSAMTSTGFAGCRAYSSVTAPILTGTNYVASIYVTLSRPLTGAEAIVVYWTGAWASATTTITSSNSSGYVGQWVRASGTLAAGATGSVYPVVYLSSVVSSDLVVYVSRGQFEAVTYQTTPSTYVATTTSAYYGPRFDYDPRPSLTGTASIAGSAVTLPAIFNDGTPASSVDNAYVGQTITVGGTGYPVTAYVGSTRIATVTGTPTSGSQSFTLTNPGYLLNRGLLVEGQLQQLLPWSEDFRDTAAAGSTRPWVYGGATVSSDVSATVAPDGTNNADKLAEDNSSGQHYIYQSISTSSTSVYTVSVYAKAAERGFMYVAAYQANSIEFCVNLTTGAITNQATSNGTIISASATSVGNGWWRITAAFSIASTSTTIQFNAATAAGTKSYVGTTGSGIYLFGAQLEARAFPTSYLPTQGGTSPFATRAAETFSLTGYANRLVEAYYIDEQTGANFSGNSTVVASGDTTISPPTFGWVTSLRAYTNAYAGSISTPSWLSFSRAGNATYYDSTGTLTFAANNLLLNTATLSTQTVTTGIIPTCDVILSFKGTGSVAISGGYTGTLAGTGASDRVFLKFTTTTASLTFTVTGTVTEAQLERVTYQTQPSLYVANTGSQSYGPRYDFAPSTVPASPRGLLIEESRANLNFPALPSTSWTVKTNVTFATEGIAPDGTASAVKVSATTTGGVNLNNGPFVVSATSASYSIYAKKGSGATTLNRFLLRNDTTATNLLAIDFNFDTGVSTYVIGSTGASSVYVGNGWWRITLSVSSGITSGNGIVIYAAASGTSYNAGEFVYLWGAQLEAGSFATSYVPTTTASVTRAADVAQLTGSALTVGQGASGSAIAQFDSSRIWQGSYLVSFDNSATAQYYNFITVTASRSDVFNNNVTQASLTYSPAPSVNTTARAAFAWAANNFAAVANNGTVQPDTSGTVPTGITTGYLGYYRDNLAVNGHIQSLALYNTRLPDAILAQKSTVGAPY